MAGARLRDEDEYLKTNYPLNMSSVYKELALRNKVLPQTEHHNPL